MQTSPEISVIIPFYNRGKLLLRAIRSVLVQTCTDYEILVVDDGSEEDYSPVIETLQLKNLKYYKLPHTNANVARNYGISQANGKFIAMLDADDEWLNHHLKLNIAIMHKHNCDGIYSSVISKQAGVERIYQVRPLYENEKMVNYLLSSTIGAQTSTLFMRKEAVKNTLWDETLRRHQDYDFVVRFGNKYNWFVNLDATSIYHCENNSGKIIDFHSCIRFIEMNINDILPEIYTAYHKRMLSYAIDLRVDKSIIEYYAINSVKFRDWVSNNVQNENCINNKQL